MIKRFIDKLARRTPPVDKHSLLQRHPELDYFFDDEDMYPDWDAVKEADC